MSEGQKYCPKCGRNYSEDKEWCEHCAVKLVSPDDFESTKTLFNEESVTVHIADNPLQAELLREILESNGIKCALVGEVPPSVFPFTVNGLARTRILVLESAAEDAKRIINEALERAERAQPESEEESADEDSDSE